MDSEVLFTITKENLETGLRGFPVGYCVTSSVDPEKGLFYCGKPLTDVVHWSCEEVIYLLLKGRQPSEEEKAQFIQEIRKESSLSKETFSYIRKLPKGAHPMDLLISALMITKTFEGHGDYEKDCIALIGKVPLIVATVINHHSGWSQEQPSYDPGLGYMENFSRMMPVPGVNPDILAEVFRLFTILHFDHGGGNLSVFVGKAVASGLQDLYGSIAAGMSALAGPRHGLANQLTLAFVMEMQTALGAHPSEEEVRAYLVKKLQNKELLYGFGHAVLRVEDPRATIFYEYAEKHFGKHPLVQLTLALRKVGPSVLREQLSNVSSPYPNIDAISGTLLTAAGFYYPEYYTLLFGLSRSIGIAIQIVYERILARGGKGTPIVRPKYLYKPRAV
jgi:citrate synthase